MIRAILLGLLFTTNLLAEDSMVQNLINSIRDQKDGFRFGKVFQIEEGSNAAVVPVINEKGNQAKDYILIDVATKVNIQEIGDVSHILVDNKENIPVFISKGHMFIGATQERASLRDVIVFPGDSVKIEVRCIHRTRGLSFNSTFKSSGLTPINLIRDNQLDTWSRCSNYVMTTSGDSLGSGGIFYSGMDNFTAAKVKLDKDLTEVMKKIPFVRDQVGVVILKGNNIKLLEVYDLVASWNDIKTAVINREGASFVTEKANSIFKMDEEKVTGFISTDLKEAINYCTCGTSEKYKVYDFKLGKYSGHALEFSNRILHLAIWSE